MRIKSSSAGAARQVAYHAGPPEIAFAGRAWQRGRPQAVTEQEWLAMQARPDFAGFGFATASMDAEVLAAPERADKFSEEV